MKSKNIQSGYTLGLTMVITSIVLLLTMSIFSLIYSEFKISDLGDQSSKAYYAADAGVECVKYYEGLYPNKGDNPNSALGDLTYGATGYFLPVGPEVINYSANSYKIDINCMGVTIDHNILNIENLSGTNPVYVTVPNMVGNFLLTRFKIRNVTQDICVDLKVYKTLSNDNAVAVKSTGYNTCQIISGPRIAREVLYQNGYVQ